MSPLYRLLGLEDAGAIARTFGWHAYAASPLALWLIGLVAAVGLAAALLNLLPGNVMSWRSRALLTAIRLAGFLLVVVMLARVELRLTAERRLPSNMALLVDASESMTLNDAGGRTRREAAQATADDLASRLKNRARISRYDFAWRLDAAEKAAVLSGATRLVKALEETLQRESDLQAVLVLTDGNDTGGDRGELVAPLFAARGVPIYPVVFGDTNAPVRGEVQLASSSPYVRLGDEFTLSAVLTGNGLADQTVRVVLYEKGVTEPLAAKENVRVGKVPVTVSFVIKPARAGEKIYRIAMEGLRGGATDRRLLAEHKIQVIDARIRTLYIDIPRDERKILGHWLAHDPVVDLATLTMLPKGGWYGQGALQHKDVGNGLPGDEADLYQYDVIIMGDIPRAYFREGGDVSETKLHWLAEFVARRGGGLVTLGGRAVYGAGNYQDSALASILPFEIAVEGDPQIPKTFFLTPTALGLTHPVMQLDGDAEVSRQAWIELPSLEGCNRVGAAKAGATVLAVRQVEGAPLPALAVQEVGKGKVLSLACDTTWRWEMMRDEDSPDRYRRFWGNAVRHLAPDPRLQPERPQIQRAKANPAVGETITLSTRLVDKYFQPIRGADVTVSVRSPSGRLLLMYPRDDRNRPGLYEYAVTLDEPGDWMVRVSIPGKSEPAEEVIRAGESDEELDDPRARPDRMADLAAATGGKAFTPEEAQDLLKTLQVKSRLDVRTCVVALWNLPLMLVLFTALVCLDCLIRKRRGMA